MTRLMQKSFVPAALVATVLAAAGLTARPAAADNPLIVRDFVLTRDIAGREPTDNVRTYGPADADAIAFARIDNSGARTTVTFKWHFEGEQHAAVQMPVGNSPGWRTWSSANLRPGDWRVELVDANGVVLTEQWFRVSPRVVARGSLEPSPDRTGRSDLYDFPYR